MNTKPSTLSFTSTDDERRQDLVRQVAAELNIRDTLAAVIVDLYLRIYALETKPCACSHE